MSMQQISDAAAAMVALKASYDGKIEAIDASIAAKEAQVDQFLASARNNLSAPNRLQFDESVLLSKTSLALPTDAADNRRTNWFELVPPLNNFFVVPEDSFYGVVNLSRAQAVAPGEYEANPFTLDKSLSRIEFVIAPVGSQSNDINTLIAQSGKIPFITGAHGLYAFSGIVPVLPYPQSSILGRLFVRIRNVAVPYSPLVLAGTNPQPVANFGGNPVFAIQSVELFKN